MPNTAWLGAAVLKTSVYWITGVTHAYKSTSKHGALQNTSGTFDNYLVYLPFIWNVIKCYAMIEHDFNQGRILVL